MTPQEAEPAICCQRGLDSLGRNCQEGGHEDRPAGEGSLRDPQALDWGFGGSVSVILRITPSTKVLGLWHKKILEKDKRS